MNARICTAVLRRFRRDESGQDLIEYGLLVALASVVAISVVSQVGTTILNVFWNVIAAAIP
jgi:Flp pilus assembly pilin Flp